MRFDLGAGTSVLNMPASVLIQTRFKKHRQLATSVSAAGLPLGNLLGPIVANRLIATFGWRGAMLLQSGITLNSVVLVFIWPRKNRIVCSRQQDEAENNASNTSSSSSASKTCSRFIDVSVLSDRLFALFMVAGMLFRFVNLVIMDHVPSRSVHMGVSKESSAFLITVMFFGNYTYTIIVT